MEKTNIVLIGMPSAGKSTIGESLSENLGKKFIDTDKIILDKEKRPLREIVNNDGLKRFLEIQEAAILNIVTENSVISTGGSVVYNEGAMKHLKNIGVVVYLKTSFEDIEKRVAEGRRFARSEEQSLEDLYRERVPLYEKYADISVDCTAKNAGTLIGEIETILKQLL